MPRGTPLDRDLAAAMRLLDAVDLPYAELWRKLGPIAADLGRPRPSYACVRAFAIEERRRKLARMALVEAFLDEASRRAPPYSFFFALVEYNTSGSPGPRYGPGSTRA